MSATTQVRIMVALLSLVAFGLTVVAFGWLAGLVVTMWFYSGVTWGRTLYAARLLDETMARTKNVLGEYEHR